MGDYLASVAWTVAQDLRDAAARAAALVAAPKPALTSKSLIRQRLKQTRAAAARSTPTTFPNALGNYVEKRRPRPSPRPLTGRERFARLAGAFLTRRQRYLNPPRGWAVYRPAITQEWLSRIGWA